MTGGESYCPPFTVFVCVDVVLVHPLPLGIARVCVHKRERKTVPKNKTFFFQPSSHPPFVSDNNLICILGGRADVEAKATAKPTPEMSSSSPSGGFFKFFIFPFRPERKFFFCSGGGRRWIIFPYDQLSGSQEEK